MDGDSILDIKCSHAGTSLISLKTDETLIKALYDISNRQVDSQPFRTASLSEQISVFPKSGSMFGGEEIRISGPCFSKAFTILARIRETNDTFHCTAINDISAVCIMPTVFQTGQVTLEVNPYGMGWNYSSSFHIGRQRLLF